MPNLSDAVFFVNGRLVDYYGNPINIELIGLVGPPGPEGPPGPTGATGFIKIMEIPSKIKEPGNGGGGTPL